MRKLFLIILCFIFKTVVFAQLIDVKSDTVCLGQETNLYIQNPDITKEYYWDLDNDGFYDDATGLNVKFTFTFSGNNFFKVLSKQGINETWTSKEKIAYVLSYPNINIINNTICNDVYIEELSKDWNSIQWKINDVIYQSVNNALDTTLENGTYRISIETEKKGCKNIFYDTLIIEELIIPIVSYPSLSCINDTLNFNIENSDLYDQLLWKFSDKTQLVSKGNKIFDTSGTIEYELFYKQKKTNCKKSIVGEFMINELPSFTIDITNESPILGEEVTLSPSIEFKNPVWNNLTENSNLTITESGTYTLTQNNQFDCRSSHSITVQFTNPQELPKFEVINEIITPFDDGVNDFFLIQNAQEEIISLTIFSRDGQEVYNSSNYQNDWNGLYNGKKLPSDSYFYQITYAGKVLTGTLHLIYK